LLKFFFYIPAVGLVVCPEMMSVTEVAMRYEKKKSLRFQLTQKISNDFRT
jgi:hypothetical protein